MQYEVIILELLSRIKKLEDEVERLKLTVNSQTSEKICSYSEDSTKNIESRNTYQKMTDEMIVLCYKSGKKISQGEAPAELADDISEETGMNRNSALMYLYAVNGMLEGTTFKRAISAKALKMYFDLILSDYGVSGLRKAIKATKGHINYRYECGHNVDSIEAICTDYENRI